MSARPPKKSRSFFSLAACCDELEGTDIMGDVKWGEGRCNGEERGRKEKAVNVGEVTEVGFKFIVGYTQPGDMLQRIGVEA